LDRNDERNDVPPVRGALRRVWRGWRAFARLVGRFNTLLVLSVIYFVVLPLFAIWRIKDPLRLSRRSTTGWTDLPEEERTVERFSLPY
jgi:hypothetical protein